MWMDRELQVRRARAHLDGKHALRNQLARSSSTYADAEDDLALWIDDQLGHPLRPIEGYCPPGGGPAEPRYRDLTALLFGLCFRQTGPGDLRVGEDDSWNGPRFERDLVSCNRCDSGSPLVHRFVREHRLPDDVTDRVDDRIGRTQLRIHPDEPPIIDLHICPFETRNLRVWFATDRHQHTIEHCLAGGAIRRLHGGANSRLLLL